MLKLQQLTKAYGATLALDRVDLELRSGEILGLLGHNGSGKSTLIKALAGVITPDHGHIIVGGEQARASLTPAEAQRLGLRFVHQNLGLLPGLTVAENLLLERFTLGHGRCIRWKQVFWTAQQLLDAYGVAVDSRARLTEITPTAQAQIAIVRALAGTDHNGAHQQILVLDEPTVFLPRKEAGALFDTLKRTAASGDGIVLVSHRLDEVLAHTDRVAVLRDGRKAAEFITSEADEEQLVAAIAGRRSASEPALVSAGGHTDAVVLSGVRTAHLEAVDLTVRAGEVVGLTGLAGSGYEDLLYALFGSHPGASGQAWLGGRPIDIGALSPQRASSMGIGLVPADRARHGIAGSLSLEENLTIPDITRYYARGRLRHRALRRSAGEALAAFGVRPGDPAARADTLSGGNQQRVVVAKWFRRAPSLLLLHEPTQGVDVGARAEIWAHIRKLASSGTAVLCTSTDIEELAALSQRVVVVADGRIRCQLEGTGIGKERILAETLRNPARGPDS
jgi:ribose transport system ATP-binding protein